MLRKCTILGLGGAMAILTVLSCVKKEPTAFTLQTLNSKNTSSASTSATTAGNTGKTTSSSTSSTTATTATTGHTTAGSTTATTSGSTTATTATTSTTASTGTTATTAGTTTSGSGRCNPDQTNVLQLEGDLNDYMYLGSVTASKAPNIYSIVATDNHMHWVTVTIPEQAPADKTYKISSPNPGSMYCASSDTAACVKFIYNNMPLTAATKNEKLYYVADPDHPSVIFCGANFVNENGKKARVTGRLKLK